MKVLIKNHCSHHVWNVCALQSLPEHRHKILFITTLLLHHWFPELLRTSKHFAVPKMVHQMLLSWADDVLVSIHTKCQLPSLLFSSFLHTSRMSSSFFSKPENGRNRWRRINGGTQMDSPTGGGCHPTNMLLEATAAVGSWMGWPCSDPLNKTWQYGIGYNVALML